MKNYFTPEQQARLAQLENQQYGNSMFNFMPNYQANSNVIYSNVTGFEGAKMYSLPPNRTGLLFDNTENVFFLKNVDSMGMQNIRKFVFKEVSLPSNNNSTISADSNLSKRIENIEIALQQLLQQKSEIKNINQKEKFEEMKK